MFFLLFLVSALALQAGPRLPSVTGPRWVGVKSDNVYDEASKSYAPVVKVGVFALGTNSMGGDAEWSDAQLSGACVVAGTDEAGRVVIVRQDKTDFFVQRLEAATGWTAAVALPWAGAALADLRKQCCPTERILLSVNGDQSVLLRPDGSGFVFSLSSGALLHSYKTGLGGAHQFNRTHFVASLFAPAERAQEAAVDASNTRRHRPEQRAARDCTQPIDNRHLPEPEAGKVVFLDWASGKVSETAARVAWPMRQLIAAEGRLFSHAPCGQYRLYEIAQDGAPIVSVMITGRVHYALFVVGGPRIAGLHYSGYVDSVSVADVDAKTHSSSSYSSLGDVKPVALLWE